MSNTHQRTIQRSFARLQGEFQEKYITHKSDRIRTLYSYSDTAEKTIVFLHGWGGSAEVWFPLLEVMKNEDINILLVDLPGFGKSSTPTQPYSVDNFCEAIAAVYDNLDMNKAILVGHSFGGQVAAKFSVTHPQLVEKLVLIDSAVIRENSTGVLAAVATVLKPVFQIPPLGRLKNWLLEKINGVDYQVNPAMYPTMKQILKEDLTPILGDIKQPTLILWGEEDDITPPDQAYTISEHISQALLVMIPNGNHYSFLNAPDTTAESLVSFIEHGM